MIGIKHSFVVAHPRRSTSSLDELSDVPPSRFMKINPILGVLLAGSVAACASSVRDLTMVKADLLSRPLQGRDESLFRIEVTTRTSLEGLRKRWNDIIRVDAHFCDQPAASAVLSRGLYVTSSGQNEILRPLWEDSLFGHTPNIDGLFTYVVFLNLESKGSPGSFPPQVAFDLATTPRAVCLHLAGGYFMHSVTSNVVQVSTGTIIEAVKRFRDSQGDNSSNNRFERSRVASSVSQGEGR
jgi:hypothetical protein